MSINKVSILMPAYNASRFISIAIGSIINQSYTNWELLICDDCSTDNTFKLLSEYQDERIRVCRNGSNLGYLKTCNFLFAQALGDFITFQDADDWSDPLRIQKQIEMFLVDTNLGICGTYARYYNDTGLKPSIEKKAETSNEKIRLEIKKRSQFCGASIMIKRQVYKEIGGYREWFNRVGNEDYDWSSRIVERFPASNIPEFLYFVRQSPNSITRRVRSERQLTSEKVVKKMIELRELNGSDWLQENRLDFLNKFEEDLLLPFRLDKSLIFRKAADISWYNGNVRNYIYSSFLACVKGPKKFLNWKYLFGSIFRLFFIVPFLKLK